MIQLPKLRKGDKVAIVSPSFAAPDKWPHVYQLGLSRLREIFDLEPVAFPTTARIGASSVDRARDLIGAFENPDIKAVIASIGGDDQIAYVKNLPKEPFTRNPKPFFGYSDNTHIANFLWLCGVPSYYGGSLFSQFAMQTRMDPLTVEFLRHALFDKGEFELRASDMYNDIGLNWDDPSSLDRERAYEPNEGWIWDGSGVASGTTWGGCLESVDELLRHHAAIPSLEAFEDIVLMTETSEEIPPAAYVFRVYRALGELGILERVRALLVGRPKAWEFDKQLTTAQKQRYREEQRATVLQAVRTYNERIPVIQNVDFGHTDPQIPFPYGRRVRVDGAAHRIFAEF